MWVYQQGTGYLWKASRQYGPGYSGKGSGKNNHEAQYTRNLGPIPVGLYQVSEPRDTEKHGPYVLPLTPMGDTELKGRDGFLVHGDSIGHPGIASEGCIILSKTIRQLIWTSGDHEVQVVP